MQLVTALLTAVIIYTIQKRLYRHFWDRNLSVRIEFDELYAECGSCLSVTEEIVNSKTLPMPVVHVKFSTDRSLVFEDYENSSVTDSYHRNDVFSLLANEKITRVLNFTATKRGMYDISDIEIVARDFFMTYSFAKKVKNNTELCVFPQKYPMTKLVPLMTDMLGEIYYGRNFMEDFYTFRGIRDYDSSCGMNRINWKATAKTGSLKVNTYDYSVEQRVRVLLNLEPNMMLKTDAMREVCIRIAATVSEYMLSQNTSVSLMTNGAFVKTGEICVTDYGTSLAHMRTINKCLAGIGSDMGLDVFMNILDGEIAGREQNVSYLVISAYCKEELLIKLDYMRLQGISVKLIVPYYDMQEISFERDYIYGMEVSYDEA